jgi:hypothetical protein
MFFEIVFVSLYQGPGRTKEYKRWSPLRNYYLLIVLKKKQRICSIDTWNTLNIQKFIMTDCVLSPPF